MVFYAAFNSISVISQQQLTLFMSSWVSPVLGWGSEVSCPRTLPRKNQEDPMWLEPRTPRLRVKHFTTEPRSTPPEKVNIGETCTLILLHIIPTFNDLGKKDWKTLCGNGEMLVTSIFSLSHNVFFSFKYKFQLLSPFNLGTSKCFQFGLVYNFVI